MSKFFQQTNSYDINQFCVYHYKGYYSQIDRSEIRHFEMISTDKLFNLIEDKEVIFTTRHNDELKSFFVKVGDNFLLAASMPPFGQRVFQFIGKTEQSAQDFYSKFKDNLYIPVIIPERNDHIVYMMIQEPTGGGIQFRGTTIFPKHCDVNLHYPKGFDKIHNKVVTKLRDERGGLMLFSGEPGTGKTNYIRNLTKLIPNRDFVFIPSFMVDSLASPQLFSLLLQNPDSILIIEDAEKVIQNRRDNPQASVVSTVLNLADGFMADMVKSSLILTFNCDESEIDPALLRKGRLKVHHKFGKLNSDESNHLLQTIGKEYRTNEPMSLADIYNLEEDTGFKEKESRKMGFGA